MGKNTIVCVGRQIGSGGGLLAKRLSERLGAKFFDKELIALAARESGFSTEVFEQGDEKKGFLRSLFSIHAPHLSGTNFYENSVSQESLFKIQSDVIRQEAERGACVFVGRCADYVLRDMPQCVKVFFTSPLDQRVARVMQRMKMSEHDALRYIERGEAARASYYNYYTGKQWGDAASYDLCIDTTQMGEEATVELLMQIIGKLK